MEQSQKSWISSWRPERRRGKLCEWSTLMLSNESSSMPVCPTERSNDRKRRTPKNMPTGCCRIRRRINWQQPADHRTLEAISPQCVRTTTIRHALRKLLHYDRKNHCVSRQGVRAIQYRVDAKRNTTPTKLSAPTASDDQPPTTLTPKPSALKTEKQLLRISLQDRKTITIVPHYTCLIETTHRTTSKKTLKRAFPPWTPRPTRHDEKTCTPRREQV